MNKNDTRKTVFEGQQMTATGRAEPKPQFQPFPPTAPGLRDRDISAASSKRVQDEALFHKLEEQQHNDYVRAVNLQLSTMGGSVIVMLAGLAETIQQWNAYQGFWESDNTGEKFMLMVSEIGEAMEADRKDLMSDHIPEFTGVEEELADAVIRILDFASRRQLRFGEALIAKLRYNLTRPYKHGKKC